VCPCDDTPPGAQNVEHWLDSARRGSAEALGQVLEYCRPYLLAVANEHMESDVQAKVGASDLVQDTFLEAQRDFGQFRGRSEEHLLAWLRQILLHNTANLSRQYRQTDKRQIQREVFLGEAPVNELLQALADDESSPSGHVLRRERDETLARALEQLSEEHRQAIELRSYERCSFEEVGRRMQRSAEAARKLWVRAIERLQQILGPADESR
jgi:RNA polymerase sigma-70 factor, ECF subfamily